MSRKKQYAIEVTAGGTQQVIVAPSVGNACRIAFRNLVRRSMAAIPGLARDEHSRLVKAGKIFSTPATDTENEEGGLFAGVSVSVRGRQVASLGEIESFSDLTKRACARAGIPWIPPCKQRTA